MATQLSLYNEALRLCGERKLASLSEDREPRRLLDGVWDAGAIKFCLEEGQWNFAMRSSKLAYSSSIEPSFGLRYAFVKPDDFVHISALTSDEYFNSPLLQYTEEAGFWFADIDEIYIKYVSNDDAYGNDLSLWPESFTRYVSAYMASEIVERLTQSEAQLEKVLKAYDKRLIKARSKDAMAGPTQFLPTGSWVRARGHGSRRTNDRGNRGSLIG